MTLQLKGRPNKLVTLKAAHNPSRQLAAQFLLHKVANYHKQM
eukprot:CAMPEP_0201284008 /NCGR_PEP_ID=MMETSP1317-20130820/58087_1 /ASSEMBLY_ACC=CAM_ASM_000770 /TAXON_ID=187299 /ORGANISM="Undescribed Undescribed, Strain Undescribed" /LENGTH=41 /DNA_ID= /DNA_START= /DNA_END= /DNA_ORIENTATION=